MIVAQCPLRIGADSTVQRPPTARTNGLEPAMPIGAKFNILVINQ